MTAIYVRCCQDRPIKSWNDLRVVAKLRNKIPLFYRRDCGHHNGSYAGQRGNDLFIAVLEIDFPAFFDRCVVDADREHNHFGREEPSNCAECRKKYPIPAPRTPAFTSGRPHTLDGSAAPCTMLSPKMMTGFGALRIAA